MLKKLFRKIIMMAETPATNWMDRHYIRIYDTPERPPKNTAIDKVDTKIKQPNGKESRRKK